MEISIPNCIHCDSALVEEIPESPLAFCSACGQKFNWHTAFMRNYIYAIAVKEVLLTPQEHLLLNTIMIYDVVGGTGRFDETFYYIEDRLNVRHRD